MNKKKNKQLIKLLKDIEDEGIFNHLGYKFNVYGMDQDDLKQELRLQVIKTWNGSSDCDDKKLGWWFLRLNWHCFNLIKKSGRLPIDNSISIHKFLSGGNEEQ